MDANTKFVYRLAAKLQAKYLAQYQEYLVDVEHWHSQGFRAAHCEHGTNQWTDWDNICGACEDGVTMRDGVQRRRRALDEAKDRVARMHRIFSLQSEAEDLDIRLDTSSVTRAFQALGEV